MKFAQSVLLIAVSLSALPALATTAAPCNQRANSSFNDNKGAYTRTTEKQAPPAQRGQGSSDAQRG